MIGYFPAASMWPPAMGLAWIFGAAALVWGLWYLIIAGILFFGAVLGWVVESDHSEQIEHGLIGDAEGTTVAGKGSGH